MLLQTLGIMRAWKSAAFFTLGLAIHVTAQIFPADQFVRWQWLSSLVDGNYLYIVGGEYYFINTTDNSARVSYNPGFHAIDITQSFNVSTVTAINITSIDTNLQARRPTVFHDPVNKSINIYGGWPYTVHSSDDVVPYVSSWSAGSGINVVVKARFGLDSGTGFPYTRKAGSLWASSDSAYYSLGGYGTAMNDPAFAGLEQNFKFPESGLLELDYNGASFTNKSTTFNRMHGEAQYIPSFGEQGVIVFLGGDKPTSASYEPSTALVDMSTITIYDIKSGKFFDQTTTGSTVPMGRGIFCSVAVSSSSNSSYEIFIFGGLPGTFNNATDTDMGTVYILSLPAFQWTRTNATSPGRFGNTCQLLGNGKSQMLNIGGIRSVSAISFWIKDNFPSGLGVFNLNTLGWQDTYDPNAAAYTTSQNVSSMYDSSGKPKTAVSFSDPTLAAIFQSKTSSNTASTTASASTSKTKTGVIVGVVIVGVALIVGLTALGFFLLRRRKQKRETVYEPAATVDMDGSEGGLDRRKQAEALHEMDVRNQPQEMDGRVDPYEMEARNHPQELG